MNLNVRINPDTEYANDIKRRLKETGGYCPCRLTRAPETKCKCKEFRDMVKKGIPGMCHCGLYIAEPMNSEVNE